MYGTLAMVPTLLTTVGQAYRPCVAGNGGRSRGWPRKPSSESSSAVSSPQMYAPGAAVDDHVQVEAGAEDVPAEVARPRTPRATALRSRRAACTASPRT